MPFDPLDLQPLQAIGLTPDVVHAMSLVPPLPVVPGGGAEPAHWMRVTEVQRDALTLHDGRGAHAARARPALLAALAEAADGLAAGDWVRAQRNAFGEWWVHDRLPPRNQLARRLHDGRDKVTRVVIVSNVDAALLVMGLDHDFNPRRLDRFVALVRASALPAVAVLTKADLCDPTLAAERLAAVRASGVEAALAVNALDGAVVRAALAAWLAPGRTLVLLGSSGAGKSTLTNALLDEARQDTGGTRKGDGRGRHTTTVRSLHALAGGACVIDTPGLRTLRLDGDEAALGAAFDDVARLAPACRFRNCRHEQEPGCAVREGVGDDRLRNFHKLQREARRDTLTALERKAQVAEWKRRGRAGRERLREKREG